MALSILWCAIRTPRAARERRAWHNPVRMCLLVALFQRHPDAPLVIAANRDERLDRPATSLGVLRALPATLGGRDDVHGGTWLAVNRDGVVAGVTNTPTGARDATRRTRGELPLRLTLEASAEEAVALFQARVRCSDYNPCWLLVGDRERLFCVTVSGNGAPAVTSLAPGIHVLENRPLVPVSPKAGRVRAALEGVEAWRGEALVGGLQRVLASHEDSTSAPPGRADPPSPEARERPTLDAACVHAGGYGTRSSSLVLVPAKGAPRVLASEGPPCETSLIDRSALWRHDRPTDRS